MKIDEEIKSMEKAYQTDKRRHDDVSKVIERLERTIKDKTAELEKLNTHLERNKEMQEGFKMSMEKYERNVHELRERMERESERLRLDKHK